MLSTLGSVASQGGLPPNMVLLSHFTSPLYMTDSLSAYSWMSTGSKSYIYCKTSPAKFGESVEVSIVEGDDYTQGFYGGIYNQSPILQTIGTQDFTVEFWYHPTQLPYQHTNPYVILGGISLNGEITGTATLNLFGYAQIRSPKSFTKNAWNFIRFGKKGDNIFLVVNGSKYTSAIAVGYSGLPTTSKLEINMNGGYLGEGNGVASFDEVMVQIGTGNDGTDIPTSPYPI